MKTWITYPAAIILGFSAHLLLGGWGPYHDVLGIAVPIANQLGLFVLFPVVFILFTSATASLRRYKDTAIVFSSTILWGLVTALLLSFLGMGLTFLLPAGFASLPVDADAASQFAFFDLSTLRELFVTQNAFRQFTVSGTSLLPIMVIALLAGLALRPDREGIRPAYVVVNSFAESMLRLARIFTVIGAALLLFISASWFESIPLRELLPWASWYLLGLLIALIAALFILLPLLFAVMTLFKGGNPFRIVSGTFPAFLAAGFTGNILYGTTPLLALSQHNNGVRKRVAGISIPLLTILGRGGSAMIATFTIIQVFQVLGAARPSLQTMLFIALFSSLFSFTSSFSLGFEVPFIILMVLQGIQSQAMGQMAAVLLVLLPFIKLSAGIIDAAVIAFGGTFCSRVVSPDDRVPFEEMM